MLQSGVFVVVLAVTMAMASANKHHVDCGLDMEKFLDEHCGAAYSKIGNVAGHSGDSVKQRILDLVSNSSRNRDQQENCSLENATSIARVLSYLAPGVLGKNQVCRLDSLVYFCHLFLEDSEEWVLRMFDASGKIPDGILLGNVYPLGNFEQCVQLEGKSPCNDGALFRGRYCLAQFRYVGCDPTRDPECTYDASWPPEVPTNEADQFGILVNVFRRLMMTNVMNCMKERKGIRLPVSRGICVPSSCTHEDIKCGLEASMLGSNGSWVTDIAEESCYSVEDETGRSAEDYVILCLFLVLAACVIIGTSYQLHRFVAEKDEADPTIGLRQLAEDSETARNSEYIAIKISGLEQFFQSFSLYTNWTQLFEFEEYRDPNHIHCIHGIRVFTTMWIILLRTYEFILYLPWINEAELGKNLERWTFDVILNGTVATDTFFLISGTLLSYNLLIKFNHSLHSKLWQDFSLIAKLTLWRCLRLLPPMLTCVAFAATTFHKVGSGPFWKTMVDENVTGRCRRNWWTNLLFINNYVHSDEPCLGHTWYVACDLHFFLIGSLVLIPLSYARENKAGMVPLTLATAAGIMIPGVITGVKFFPPTLVADHMMTNIEGIYVKDFFIVSHTRFGAYAVGLWLGFVLFRMKDRYDSIPMPYWATGWVLSIVTAISVLYGMHGVNTIDSSGYTTAAAVSYSALHRAAWALAIGWIIFACQRGYAGLIDSLLAWRGWVPYSRLSYSVYLSSYFVQLWYYVSRKVSFHFDHDFMVSMFFGQVMGSFLVGMVLFLVVEAPATNLFRLAEESWHKRVQAKQERAAAAGARDISVISNRAMRLKPRGRMSNNSQPKYGGGRTRFYPNTSIPKVIQRKSSVYFRRTTPSEMEYAATTPSMSRAASAIDLRNLGGSTQDLDET